VLVVLAAVGASLAVGGYRRSQVLLSSGTVWLASPGGLVTLIDGPSEQVVGNVQTSARGPDAPEVVQTGNSALVVDQHGGAVSRIDGATYALTGPKRMGQGGPLQVLPAGGGSAFVVDGGHGQAALVDTTTLVVRRTLRLGAEPGPDQAAVDGSGNLWVVDAGGLARIDQAGAVDRFHGVGNASSRLVTSQGAPVLVDVPGGRVGRIDDAGAVPSWQCTGLRFGSDPQLLPASGTSRVYAAVSDTGRLVTADLASDNCSSIGLSSAGSVLARPVEDDGFVLVPDQTRARAIVVDPGPGRVVARESVGTPGRDVQLVAKDGLVFYNDVAGQDAGVVRFQDGQWVASPRVAKFAAGNAVPSLAAASTLAASQSVQGLPPSPITTRSATTVVVPTTTSVSSTSLSAPTTTTAPTTTWPTTTSTTTWPTTTPPTTTWSTTTPPTTSWAPTPTPTWPTAGTLFNAPGG
jgi:hypothetical protein